MRSETLYYDVQSVERVDFVAYSHSFTYCVYISSAANAARAEYCYAEGVIGVWLACDGSSQEGVMK